MNSRTRSRFLASLTRGCLASAVLVACSASQTTSDAFDSNAEDAGAQVPGRDAIAETAPSLDGAVSDAATSCKLPGKYGSKECTACVAAKCCAQVAACEADPQGKLLQACVLHCLASDPDAGGCYNGCLATYPTAQPLWNAVEGCYFGTPPEGCLIECT